MLIIQSFLGQKPTGKTPLGRNRCRHGENIYNHTKVKRNGMYGVNLVMDREK
jgi:hypothetical protein